MIAQLADFSKNDIIIGMEAMWHYSLSVYAYLYENGFEVIKPPKKSAV